MVAQGVCEGSKVRRGSVDVPGRLFLASARFTDFKSTQTWSIGAVRITLAVQEPNRMAEWMCQQGCGHWEPRRNPGGGIALTTEY